MHEEFDNAAFQLEDYSYTIKNKFDSGTTVEMVFWVEESDQLHPALYVEVCLKSYTKRRQADTPDFFYTVRGRDDLKPAMWATDLLLKFPAFLLNQEGFQHKGEVVYNIHWQDARRRDVYHKWLSRYGFYFDQNEGKKCLSKVFSRPSND